MGMAMRRKGKGVWWEGKGMGGRDALASAWYLYFETPWQGSFADCRAPPNSTPPVSTGGVEFGDAYTGRNSTRDGARCGTQGPLSFPFPRPPAHPPPPPTPGH